ncbi:MAG: helix-turn-helix domain-containing protein [Candidatus Cryosericum sp.]
MERHEAAKALSDKRSSLGLSLDDAARATLLRRSVLETLEAEGPAELDGFYKSYLRRYARYLGLDEDGIVAAFAGTSVPAAAVQEPSPHPPIPPTYPRSNVSIFARKRSLSSSLGILAVALLLALVLLWHPWGGQVPAPGSTTTTPSTPAEAVNPSTPSTPASGQETSTGAPVEKVLSLTFAATTQRAWLQIRADGAIVFSGVLRPGDSTQVSGNYVVVDFGNARYTTVTENGVDKGVVSSDKTVLTVEYGSPAHAP